MSSESSRLKSCSNYYHNGCLRLCIHFKCFIWQNITRTIIKLDLKALKWTSKYQDGWKMFPHLVGFPPPCGFYLDFCPTCWMSLVFGMDARRTESSSDFCSTTVRQNRNVKLLIQLWLQQWDLQSGFVYATKSQGGVSEFMPCGYFSRGSTGGCKMTKDASVEISVEMRGRWRNSQISQTKVLLFQYRFG